MKKKLLIGVSLASGLSIFAASLSINSRSDCQLSDGSAGTIYELFMGDRSCDGHCMSGTRNVCSNFSYEEINAAYSAATQKVDFDYINDIAEEYEDNTLPADKLKTLRDNGIATWTFEDEEYLEEGETLEHVSLDEDSHSEIYLQLIKLGNENFKAETLKGKGLNIGGYGLFSH